MKVVTYMDVERKDMGLWCGIMGQKKYVGDFKNGNSHGNGKCVWSGLFEYNGSFRNGVPDGTGVMEYTGGAEPGGVWHNGGKYEGEWREKKKHGNGVYSDKLGNRFEGHWHNGEGLIGKYTLINGKTYSSKFDINVFLNFSKEKSEVEVCTP